MDDARLPFQHLGWLYRYCAQRHLAVSRLTRGLLPDAPASATALGWTTYLEVVASIWRHLPREDFDAAAASLWQTPPFIPRPTDDPAMLIRRALASDGPFLRCLPVTSDITASSNDALVIHLTIDAPSPVSFRNLLEAQVNGLLRLPQLKRARYEMQVSDQLIRVHATLPRARPAFEALGERLTGLVHRPTRHRTNLEAQLATLQDEVQRLTAERDQHRADAEVATSLLNHVTTSSRSTWWQVDHRAHIMRTAPNLHTLLDVTEAQLTQAPLPYGLRRLLVRVRRGEHLTGLPLTWQHPAGHRLHFSVSGPVDAAGHLVARDITASVQRDALTARTATTEQALLDAFPDPAARLDEDFRIVAANHAFCQLAAAAPARLHQSLITEWLPQSLASRELNEALASSAPGATGIRGHFLSQRRDLIAVDITLAQVGLERLCILQPQTPADAPDQAERLARSANLVEMGQLTAGIAHDFNNMLIAIDEYGRLAETSLRAGDPDTGEHLAALRATSRASRQLTRQLLDQVHGGSGEFTATDLVPLLQRLTTMMSRLMPSHIALTFRPAVANAVVDADAGAIGQVLTNLIINARDAMPDGGEVSIRLSTTDGGFRVDVADNGAGIPVELQEKVFEPLFTTKAPGEGTGLGLAQIARTMAIHRGEVKLESTPGTGTCFTLMFPSPPLSSVQQHEGSPTG